MALRGGEEACNTVTCSIEAATNAYKIVNRKAQNGRWSVCLSLHLLTAKSKKVSSNQVESAREESLSKDGQKAKTRQPRRRNPPEDTARNWPALEQWMI